MTFVRPLAALFTLSVASVAAQASNDLARSKNCVACHHLERKTLGPAFKDIAAKYGDDGAAIKTLTEKVQKGGVGVWGPMPMPAQPQVSAEEAEALVKWILSLK
ncbi:MAG: c-type cytochrome [Burkholderiaceae bacterium]|nr:c-type cytochrome [Burkholderiaceae bacterium]